jgi:hypothetical protein
MKALATEIIQLLEDIHEVLLDSNTHEGTLA